MGLARKLATWRRLDRADRRAVRSALPVLIGASAALRSLGFARTHRLFAARAVTGDGDRGIDGVEHLATGVRLAARALPWRPKCLDQSLALAYLLRRCGCAAVLRIGVRKPAGEARVSMPGPIEAHAWVECQGRAVAERADVAERFAAFDDAPHATAAAVAALR